MNKKKEGSFRDAKKPKEFWSNPFLRSEQNFKQYNASLPIDTVKRNAIDVRKEVTCSLIKVKKERKSPIVPLDFPNFFMSTKTTRSNKRITTKIPLTQLVSSKQTRSN